MMELREAINEACSKAITKCLRMDYCFDRYATVVTDAVLYVLRRQKPVAVVQVHKTGGNAGIAWSAAPINEYDSLPVLRDGERLYLATGAVSVPNGWQIVPIEPTISMCIAADNARITVDDPHIESAIYRAMLAAAPKLGER